MMFFGTFWHVVPDRSLSEKRYLDGCMGWPYWVVVLMFAFNSCFAGRAMWESESETMVN